MLGVRDPGNVSSLEVWEFKGCEETRGVGIQEVKNMKNMKNTCTDKPLLSLIFK